MPHSNHPAMPSIIRHVDPVAQPQGSNLCWAAVTAMLTGRSGSGAVNQVVELARSNNVPIDADNALNASTGVPALARAFNRSCRQMSGLLPGSDVSSRLTRGPIGLFGVLRNPPAGGTPRHAVVLHGITGEEFDSASGSTVLGVDPRGFTAINMTFWNLQSQFTIEYIVWQA
jgi:hypothetical protein